MSWQSVQYLLVIGRLGNNYSFSLISTLHTSMTPPMHLMLVETLGQEELVGGIQLGWEGREDHTG